LIGAVWDFDGANPEPLLNADEPADVPDEDVDMTEERPSVSLVAVSFVPRVGVNFLGALMSLRSFGVVVEDRSERRPKGPRAP
jgi:hypothetical protein